MKRSRHYRILTLLIIAVLAISTWLPVYAATFKDNSSQVTIKVAFYPLDGFFEYDENGNETGYGVAFLNELSKYANIKWEYVKADSWEGIKQMMIDGEVDVRMPVSEPVTPSRDYDYTVEPMMSTYHAIMTSKNRTDLYYQDYETISSMRLGIVSSLYEKVGVGEYLSSIGAANHLSFYPDYNSCKEAMDQGELDGLISNVMDLTEDMKILDKFSVVNNYITTWKGNACYPVINNAMTRLKLENPSFISQLYARYYPDWSWEPFSKVESQYIANKKSITIAVYPDRKPVSYYDKDSETYQGIAIDAANLLSQKIGIPFQYIPVTTRNPEDMLKTADMVMPVWNNPDENQYFITSSLLDTQVMLAVRTGREEVQDGAKVGILSTTPGISDCMQQENNYQLISYDTNEEALRALQSGKIAAFANASYVLNWQLENPRYGDLTVLHYQGRPLAYRLVGNGDEDVLQSVINKGIHSLSSDDIDAIIRQDSQFVMSDLSWKDRIYVYHQQIIAAILIAVLLLVVLLMHNRSRNNYIRQIEESSEKERKANQAKSQFLARMSHDMRTPLNVIIGMEQLARDNDNPKDTSECLEKIGISSEFLLGLINDALDMEHMESGKMKLRPLPYSKKEFSQYIDSVIVPLCNQKNIHFHYSYEGLEDFTIMQDKLRINQVYFNLLSNAVKYTPENGMVTFHTKATQVNSQTIALDVTIADTGIGMSQEFQKHMFESFTQENQQISSITQGSGLGLEIVKNICNMMNIDIQVDSQLHKGTTFRLHGEFPSVETSGADVTRSQQEEIDIQTELKNRMILVCEDHPMNQEIIRRLLEKKGMVPVLAENGKRGVELFQNSAQGDYAAILMDIRMPVMDGLTATREIRRLSRPDSRYIPIIALTANAYEEDIHKCLEVGMNAHLAKPIDAKLLYQILGEQIEQTKSHP